MSEVIGWPEANISVYTGTGATSAVIAYAQNVNLSLTHGWLNRQSLDGTYTDFQTGQRADVTFGAFYYDKTMTKMFESATAVHIKLSHTQLGASGGYYLYSGHFNSLALAGAENGLFTENLSYYTNHWSAY